MPATMRRYSTVVRALACCAILAVPAIAFAAPTAQPERAEVSYSKGLVDFNRGDLATALSKFREAAQLDPKNPMYPLMVGTTENRLHNYSRAAGPLEDALALKPNLKGARFELGVAYCGMGRWKEALANLQAARDEDPERGAVHLYLGLAHEGLRQDAEALTEFERAGSLDPSLAEEARLHAGRIYMRQGVNDRAAREFQAASASRNQSLAQLSQDYLGQIQGRRIGPPKRWDFYGYAATDYDSNVVLRPSSPDVAFPVTNEADERLTFYGHGEYRPYVGPRASWGLGLGFYQSLYQDLDGYDMQGFLPAVSFEYRRSSWRLRSEGSFQYYNLDNDSYLRRYDWYNSISFDEGRSSRTGFSYIWRDDDYFGDEERDGQANLFGVDQYFYFSANRSRYFRVGGAYEDHGAGNDFDYDAWSGSVDFYTPIGKHWDFLAAVYYTDYGYTNVDSYYGVERNDEEWTAVVRTVFDINDWMGLQVESSYRDHGSNIDFFEYDRWIVSVAFVAHN